MNFVYNNPILANIHIPKGALRFKSQEQLFQFKPIEDSFCSSPIKDRFSDKEKVVQIVQSNPAIMKILKENNIRLNINMTELNNLSRGHMADTRVTVAKTCSALPKHLRNDVNYVDLQDAAQLHDIGKVFIPKDILNKQGKLSENEMKIMQLHSELGYELLKSDPNINKNVLNMVKYHHQNPNRTGYPEITNGYEYDISAQILNASDKYNALREARCYKDSMSREQALEIIRQDVNDGNILPDVYEAISKAVKL